MACSIEPEGHEWRLTIEQGDVTLTSGCTECDDLVLSPAGIDAIDLDVPVVGTLRYEEDHPNRGGWHGLERCDCSSRWVFAAEGVTT